MTGVRAIWTRARDGAPPTLWVLIVLVVVLAIIAPGFATTDNMANIGRTAAVLALAACGQAIVIITRGIDLSAASAVALMSVITVLEIGAGTGAAFALGALAVLAIGALNGLLVARFDIPPFLVTLGMLTGVHGLAALLVAGIPVEAPPGGAFSWPSNGNIGPFSVPLVLAVVGFAVLAMLLRRTTLGRVWYLVGSNPGAARTAGLRVRGAIFLAYLVGAAYVAVAGLILTARVHSGQPDLYPTLAFEAIAACAIGGLSLNGGTGRVTGVLVGVLIVAMTANGVVLLNLSVDFQLMIVGTLTVGSVLASRRRMGGGRAWRVRRAPMGQAPSTHPATEKMR